MLTMNKDNTSQQAWKKSVLSFPEPKVVSITLWQATKQLNEKHVNKTLMTYRFIIYLFMTFWTEEMHLWQDIELA